MRTFAVLCLTAVSACNAGSIQHSNLIQTHHKVKSHSESNAAKSLRKTKKLIPIISSLFGRKIDAVNCWNAYGNAHRDLKRSFCIKGQPKKRPCSACILKWANKASSKYHFQKLYCNNKPCRKYGQAKKIRKYYKSKCTFNPGDDKFCRHLPDCFFKTIPQYICDNKKQARRLEQHWFRKGRKQGRGEFAPDCAKVRRDDHHNKCVTTRLMSFLDVSNRNAITPVIDGDDDNIDESVVEVGESVDADAAGDGDQEIDPEVDEYGDDDDNDEAVSGEYQAGDDDLDDGLEVSDSKPAAGGGDDDDDDDADEGPDIESAEVGVADDVDEGYEEESKTDTSLEEAVAPGPSPAKVDQVVNDAADAAATAVKSAAEEDLGTEDVDDGKEDQDEYNEEEVADEP